MARYIDLEELEKRINENIKPENREEKELVEWCKDECIRQAYCMPTADVAEVKHGKWNKEYDRSPRYVCTVCNHLFNNKGYKYCPNCGARMDGE